MQIDLRNDELVIVADRRYIPLLRALPDRRWDSKTGLWFASYTRENYAQMVANGWPVGHIAPPAQSSFSVDVVRVGSDTGLYFSIKTPGKAEQISLCRGIPEHRTWSTSNRAWLCKVTARNLAYLRQNFAAAEWTPAAVKLSEKLGTEEPVPQAKAPVDVEAALSGYKFKTKPYAHQKEALALSSDVEAFALLMEQRTGKTKVVIDTAAMLRMRGKIEAVLVICPNSVKDVWPEELAVHLPEWVDAEIVVDGPWSRKDVARLVEQPSHKMKWLITNEEALASKDREKVYAFFLAKHRTLVAVDEFTGFKNPTAQRTKALLRLRKYSLYRRIMSGTPVASHPLDIYAPYKFLDPAILGFPSWTQCRVHHAIMGGFQAKQVVGYVKLEELAAKIAPHSFRRLTAECFDLPPIVYKKRIVAMSGEQQRIYDDLRDELVAELASGARITAPHALVRMMRLAQITGGFAVPDAPAPIAGDLDDDGWNMDMTKALETKKTVEIPGGNAKLTALLEDIAALEPSEKVVIWARFRAEIDLLEKKLKSLYGDDAVVVFHGGVSTDDRTIARQRFQGRPDAPQDPRCRFLVGQTDTGSQGIKLAIANTAMYYSNSFSLKSRQQSEMRIIDDNPVAKCVIDYEARRTIDRQLIVSLRSKKKFADSITGDAWKEWL